MLTPAEALSRPPRRRPKYPATPETDAILRRHYDSRARGRIDQLARRIGWPAWVVQRRAQELGLTRSMDRRVWSEDERKNLERWAGRKSLRWIARKLRRTPASVQAQARTMDMHLRLREGYSMRDVAVALGVAVSDVRAWIDQGWLSVRARHRNGHANDAQVCDDAALLTFMANYRQAWRLDRVDPSWFWSLIEPGMARAIATAREACRA